MTLTLDDLAAAAPEIGRPTSVVRAIAKVMGALPAIGKDGKADPAQGGYRYREIEQITAGAQRLLAEHGVVFVPRVTAVEIVDITVNNKPWTDTRLTVEYVVYGPEGDHITVGPLLAIGRDNSDKGANKAMTQAYKQALLQVFCVADPKDDTDGTTHEADTRRQEDEPWRALGYTDPQHLREVNDALRAMFHNLPEDHQPRVKAWLKDLGYDRPVPVQAAHADAYRRVMEGLPPAVENPAPEPKNAKAKQLAAKVKAVVAYAEAKGIPETTCQTLADHVLGKHWPLHELSDPDAATLESMVEDLIAGRIAVANGSVLTS